MGKFHTRLKEGGFHDWVMLAATVAIAVSTIFYASYARNWSFYISQAAAAAVRA